MFSHVTRMSDQPRARIDSSQASGPGNKLAAWLVAASYALLIPAWVAGNPPNAAPDEIWHYLRAVGIGHGQLLGRPAGLDGAKAIVGPERPPYTADNYGRALAWVAQNTRKVRIPEGLAPGWLPCEGRDPRVSAACLHSSPLSEARDWFIPTGTYQPLPYLVPAVISRIGAPPDTLSLLMRAGKALISLLFIGAAVFLLWSPEPRLVSLVGIPVALTPMAVFLSATLNPSGLEITSALAFFSALLRLGRGNAHPGAWLTLGVSGFVLALSRLQGPVWVLLHFAVVLLLTGVRPALRTALRQRHWSLFALITVVFGILLNRLWEYLYGPRMHIDPTPLGVSLLEGVAQVPRVLQEQIGVFNYLEFGLPQLAYVLWGALTVALCVTALLLGSGRQRLVLLMTAAAALTLPVLLVAASMRHTGFGLQGRYVLPFSLVVPLLAGEIVASQYQRLRAINAGHLFFPFAFGVALVQLIAWWKNAYRFGVGVGGPLWFFGSAEWNPPGGWWPWLALASGGASLLLLAAPVDWFLTRHWRGQHARTANRLVRTADDAAAAHLAGPL
jgi:hypothetical protein